MGGKKTEGLELLNHNVERGIETHHYTIKDEEGVLIYKEWIQDGKVIDSTLEGKHGDTIWDEDLIQRVQDFVDEKIQAGEI